MKFFEFGNFLHHITDEVRDPRRWLRNWRTNLKRFVITHGIYPSIKLSISHLYAGIVAVLLLRVSTGLTFGGV
jgi:hypothetical protein